MKYFTQLFCDLNTDLSTHQQWVCMYLVTCKRVGMGAEGTQPQASARYLYRRWVSNHTYSTERHLYRASKLRSWPRTAARLYTPWCVGIRTHYVPQCVDIRTLLHVVVCSYLHPCGVYVSARLFTPWCVGISTPLHPHGVQVYGKLR